MKRVISLIISLAMILGIFLPYIPANAQDTAKVSNESETLVTEEFIDLNVNPTIWVEVTEAEQEIYCKFVPEESNIYRIYTNSCGADTDGYLYDEAFQEIAYNDDVVEGYLEDFSILYQLEAGKTYYIKIKSFFTFMEEEYGEVLISVHAVDEISQMQLDVPFRVDMVSHHEKVLRFIPEESTIYCFYSELISGYHFIHGELYDSEFTKIKVDESDQSGFDFSVDLTAGETYYLYTTFGDMDYWEGTYNVIVKSIENRATSIQINHDGPVTGYVGEEYNLTAKLEPEGCIKEDIIWESSDETIATVKGGWVTFISAGRVTITARTEKTGLEDSIEVVVNEIPVIEVRDNLEVTIDTEEKINYRFIPAESGYYKIHVLGDKEYPSWVMTECNNGLSFTTSSSYNSFTTGARPFAAGEIYSVKAGYDNGEEGVFHVRFQKVLPELSLNDDKWWTFTKWYEEIQYRFSPKESDIYSLRVLYNSSSSYTLRIYDENLNLITEGYDNILSYYYEEGKTYYLGVCKVYGGNLSIILEKGVAIDKLEIETLPSKVYFEGVEDSSSDWFEGMKLKATLEDGTVLYCEPYSSGYFPTIAGFEVKWEMIYTEEREIQEIIITCGRKEVKISPEKIENPVESIEVAYDQIGEIPVLFENVGGWYSGTEYIYDTSVFNDLPIRIHYKDGSSLVSYRGCGVDGYYIQMQDNQLVDPWKLGSDNSLTISYAGKEVEVPVTIVENPVERIVINKIPNKEYVWGDIQIGYMFEDGTYYIEYLDLNGLLFTVYYKDGTEKQFTYDDIDDNGKIEGCECVYYILEGMIEPDAEEITIYFEYMECSAEYKAKVVNETTVASIEVIEGPKNSVYDTDYVYSPDFAGMKIKITYIDGTSKIVELKEENLEFVFENWGYDHIYTLDDGTKIGIGYEFSDDAYCYLVYQGKICIYDGISFSESVVEKIELIDEYETEGKLVVQFTYEDGTSELVEVMTTKLQDELRWTRTRRGILIYGIQCVVDETGNVKEYIVEFFGEPIRLMSSSADKQEIEINADAITKEQSTIKVNIEGAGTYTMGDSVTVLAEEKLGYEFMGWYEFSEDGNSYVGNALSEELSYTFVAEENRNLVAVYEMVGTTTLKVNGAQFKVNDGVTQLIYNYTQDFNVGEEIKLTATGENFAYWMNESNKIVSTEREYTFTLSQPTIVTVVYKNAVEGDAFVEFVSDYDQVLQAQNYSSTSKILLPNGPSKSGHIFKNWNMTVAEIKAAIAEGETYIRVTPVYEKIVEYFDVTVVYDGNTEGAQAYQDVLGYEFLQLSAKAIEGRKFAYWSDALTNGNVLSTSNTYSLYVNKDIMVYAIYVDAEEEVEVNPIITMTNAYTSEDVSGTKKVHFEATRNIPEGYTLQEHGVIYSTSSSYGEESAEDTMIIGASDVNKNIAKTTGNEGVYVLNVSIGTKVDTTIFARGYMILTNNTTGENETFYSQIMSGSYNSLKERNEV